MNRIELQLDEWESAALRTAAVRSGVDLPTMARRLLDRQLALYMDRMTNRMLEQAAGPAADGIEVRLLQLFEA